MSKFGWKANYERVAVLLQRCVAENERLEKERGMACYQRDCAKSVVEGWERRAVAAEAERDKLREMVDRYFLAIYTLQQQIPDELLATAEREIARLRKKLALTEHHRNLAEETLTRVEIGAV